MPPLPPPALPIDQSRQVMAMGTLLGLRLPPEAGQRALDAVARVEALGSTWRQDTPWSRMAVEPGAWIQQDPETLEMLRIVMDWSRRTEGAFDPMLAPLVKAYGLRTGGRIPSVAEREAARTLSGLRHLEVDASRARARITTPGAGIEEGGFLKGHALDQARAASGASEGFLDFGGQLLAWGSPLRVGIADPADRSRERLHLRLENASLSTTSCSERGRHLIDPSSGAACPRWGSVSVLHPSALVADLLSTALYVMGPRKGLAWSKAHDVAAVFLTLDGQCFASPAFAKQSPLHTER